MYWPEEDAANAVATKKIIDPCLPVIGQPCTVLLSKQKHSGMLIEIGTNTQHILLL